MKAMKRYYIFFAILAAVAILAIVSNILLRRGPVHDAQASADIRQLQMAVDRYYLAHNNQLPQNLSETRLEGDVTKRLNNYEYSRLSARSFVLCATFMTARTATDRDPSPSAPDDSAYPSAADIPNPYTHGKGKQCFTYTEVPLLTPTLPTDLPYRR